MGLDETQEQQMRQLIEARCEQVRQQVEKLKQRSRPVSLDDPIGRVSRIDAIQHREMALAGYRREEDLLKRIVAALDRLDRHSFGNCEGCKAPIAWERLVATPEVQFCIRCTR